MLKRYLTAYGLWLAGVLAAAGLAFYYYRRVLAIGEAELAAKVAGNGSRSGPARARRAPAPDDPEPEPVELAGDAAASERAPGPGGGAEPPVELHYGES